MVHVQQVLNAIRQKGLVTAYKKAYQEQKECTQKLTKANEALANYTGEDAKVPKVKAIQKAPEASKHMTEAVAPIINQFQLYSNLLLEAVWLPWNKVIGEQIDCKPWTNLYSKKHTEKHQRSWVSSIDCVTFHLLTTFSNDATKMEWFYISNRLEKPNRAPFQQFVHRIQQLNSYLDLFSCLYYSKLTKVMKLFDDVDLPSHILRMVPRHWQDQYELAGATVSQGIWKLLEVLE